MYVLTKMYLIIDIVDQSIRSRYVNEISFYVFKMFFSICFFSKCSFESIHV